MERSDIAWAAGLFEGEGCFTWSRSKAMPAAKIGSTDFDVLEKFQRVVGFGRIGAAYQKGGFGTKPSRVWETTRFEYVQALIAYFWPWLCQRRRARAKEVLAHALERSRACRRRPRGTMLALFPGRRAVDLSVQENRQYQKAIRMGIKARAAQGGR